MLERELSRILRGNPSSFFPWRVAPRQGFPFSNNLNGILFALLSGCLSQEGDFLA
jgi:hypothetical protein